MNYWFITLIPLALLLFLWCFRARVDKTDFLRVLDDVEWKSGREIRDELKQVRKGFLSGPRVYEILSQLVDDGLVERDVRPQWEDGVRFNIAYFRKAERDLPATQL